MLHDIDPSDFWDDDRAGKAYEAAPLTDAGLRAVESELGFKLPAAYVALMRTQNGGIPKRGCFPLAEPIGWTDDEHLTIVGIMGIGRESHCSLLGEHGSAFMQREWGYPDIGVCICDTPSAGHEMIMLDYRQCGPEGEPAVVHVDQESDFHITRLAPDFVSFVRGLVEEPSSDDDQVATMDDDMNRVVRGSFSSSLQALIAASAEPAVSERRLRALLAAIVDEKGHFSLHADPKSALVYDVLFDLLVSWRKMNAREFLDWYPGLMVSGDGACRTGGYGPGFVLRWLEKRLARGEIVDGERGARFSESYRQQVVQALAAYD